MKAYIIGAPYPDLQKFLILPQPQFGDSEALDSRTVTKQTMSGAIHANKSSRPGQNQFAWTFNLPRMKMQELIDFVRLHHSNIWQVQRNMEIFRIVLLINPLTTAMINRNVVCDSLEAGIITLQFEGKP